jgi:hypothetical protein
MSRHDISAGDMADVSMRDPGAFIPLTPALFHVLLSLADATRTATRPARRRWRAARRARNSPVVAPHPGRRGPAGSVGAPRRVARPARPPLDADAHALAHQAEVQVIEAVAQLPGVLAAGVGGSPLGLRVHGAGVLALDCARARAASQPRVPSPPAAPWRSTPSSPCAANNRRWSG